MVQDQQLLACRNYLQKWMLLYVPSSMAVLIGEEGSNGQWAALIFSNAHCSKRTRGEPAGLPPDAPLRSRPHACAAGHMPMMCGSPRFHPGVLHDPYAYPGASILKRSLK